MRRGPHERRRFRPSHGRGSQTPHWAKALQCTRCGAAPGEDCRNADRTTTIRVHLVRVDAARAAGLDLPRVAAGGAR